MDDADQEPAGANAFLERVPWWTVPAILLGIPLVAAIISVLSPDFFARVIWQYYWGPIVADALEAGTAGIERYGVVAHGGYNAVNTVSWAILLFTCVLGAAQLLHRFRVEMSERMILASTLWVITGSVFHVLQDAQLFEQPLEYYFITPPIWLIYAAFGLGSMMFGVYLQYVQRETGSLEQAVQKTWFLFTIFVLGYALVWLIHAQDPAGSQFNEDAALVNPVFAALYAAVALFALRGLARKTGRIEPWQCVGTFSIGWLLLSIHQYAMYWRAPWPGKVPGDEMTFTLLLVPALAGATVLIVAIVAKQLLKRGIENAAAFLKPINLFLIFSQMVDAFSTSVGLDLGPRHGQSYDEKHLLSEIVINSGERFAEAIGWGWGAAHPTFVSFATVKLVVSLLVVYAIDVSSKEDAAKHPTMINLIKLAVIMVGIGPGIRNTLRMTLSI